MTEDNNDKKRINKKKIHQEMKRRPGRLVGNDWERIQLAGFPDESREKSASVMMKGEPSRAGSTL